MSGCSLSLSLPSLLTKKPRRKVIITWKNKKLPKKQPKKCTMNTDKLVLGFFFVSCKRNSFLWRGKVFSPEVLVMDTRLTETWNITENNTRRMNDLFLLKGIRNNEWESCSWFKNNKNRLHSLVSANCPVDGGTCCYMFYQGDHGDLLQFVTAALSTIFPCSRQLSGILSWSRGESLFLS